MDTTQDRQDIGTLKTDVAVLKTDVGYIKTDLKKVVDFVDANKSGITTASLLNSKIITFVLTGIVGVALYLLGKGSL